MIDSQNDSKASQDEEYSYKVEIIWAFPYVGGGITSIKGFCLQDAIDKFYQKNRYGEIVHVFE
ncbi:MAG: hypothetical protein IM618_11195 [Cytophagales bacterium]|jgi:hypothetical protein|nr:hypothetical protein [Cytophagales bacterium]